jgi:hypothetical protein
MQKRTAAEHAAAVYHVRPDNQVVKGTGVVATLLLLLFEAGTVLPDVP